MSLVAADQLCFAILVNHLDPPTFAHIHRGAAGTNGPIEVTLFPGPVAPPTTGDPAYLTFPRRARLLPGTPSPRLSSCAAPSYILLVEVLHRSKPESTEAATVLSKNLGFWYC